MKSLLLLPALLGVAASLTQFTPDQADWSTFYSKPESAPRVQDHSPDGIKWLRRNQWVAWDGKVIDPSSMSRKAFAKKICPSGQTILGLRKLFYEHMPFADNSHPTKAEVDEWHRLSIEHLRKLVGNMVPIEKDHCIFARALWAQERRWTRKWDAKYTEQPRCGGSTNAHCGASFLPDAADQAAYLPAGHKACGRGAGAEGVFVASKSNIPWSIKWVRSFCDALETEGFNGGHVGPFFRRTKFGWSFWDINAGNFHSGAVFRGKWGGNLV